jgi:hypothetical protein
MQSSPGTVPARPDAQRTARYTHLVDRLRSRQITMEEATELFGMMQGMLRASEAARIGRPPSTEPKARVPPREPAAAAAQGFPPPDDLLLAGILAMGAGAGLLAALTKKLAQGAPTEPPSSPGRPGARAPSR